MEHTITAVLSTPMSSGPNKPYKNPGDVNFLVNYSDDYKGPKNMPNGDVIIVSKEVAADFVNRGIGEIVKDEPKAEESTTTEEVAADFVNTKKGKNK